MPRSIQTAMNNVRNFVTRSTDNINSIRFQNARSTTGDTTATMVSRNELEHRL